MSQSRRKSVAIIAGVVVFAAVSAGFVVSNRYDDAKLPPSTLGMYVGFDRGDRFVDMERVLDAPIRWIVTMLDMTSASAMRSSAWGQFVTEEAFLSELSDRIDVVVSVPLAFGRMGQSEDEKRANLLETAGGRWDDDYRVIARHLENAGYGNAVIRLGHEFDAEWAPWSARNNSAEFIDAFRHVRNVLAAESSAFRFDWTSTRAGFEEWGPPSYPGDDYVDIIGLDIYYRSPDEITDAVWDSQYETTLTAHRDFAISRRKPVSFPEWGRAMADTGRYVELMHGWLDSLPERGPGRLVYQAYFNPEGPTEYNLDNLPTVKQVYIATFGG